MRATVLKLFLRFCACLPLAMARATGGALARLAILIPNRSREVTRTNIDLCFPDWSSDQRQRLARRSLIETGKTVTEMGALWYWPGQRVLNLVDATSGKAELDAALARGHGAVLATPHLGNWEMVGLYSSSLYPMTSLYRPPRLEELDVFMQHARERLGARLVPANARGVRALYKALEHGDLVGILPDQEPNEGGGIHADFFGVPAYTMTLIGRLVNKTGAAVFFAYAERLGGGRGFHLHYMPGPADLAGRSIEEITAAINEGVEAIIRRAPEQYQWSYKRFNKRPAGEQRLY